MNAIVNFLPVVVGVILSLGLIAWLIFFIARSEQGPWSRCQCCGFYVNNHGVRTRCLPPPIEMIGTGTGVCNQCANVPQDSADLWKGGVQ